MALEIPLCLVVRPQVLHEAERNLRRKLPQALPIFAEIMAVLDLELVPDPPPAAYQRWSDIIEAKDAPILEAAVQARVDKFLALNTKDFTPAVAAQASPLIQTPAQFISELRNQIPPAYKPRYTQIYTPFR